MLSPQSTVRESGHKRLQDVLAWIICLILISATGYIYTTGCDVMRAADSLHRFLPRSMQLNRPEKIVDLANGNEFRTPVLEIAPDPGDSENTKDNIQEDRREQEDLYLTTPSNYTLRRINHFPAPYEPSSDPTSFDSQAESIILTGQYGNAPRFSYHLCVFRNVCVMPNGIFFHFTNRTHWNHYEKILVGCRENNPNHPNEHTDSICACFHANNRGLLVPFEEFFEDGKTKPQSPFTFMNSASSRSQSEESSQPTHQNHHHAWLVNKWVQPHHIAHWAQKLLFMQAALQHWDQFKDLKWIGKSGESKNSQESMLFPSIPGSAASLFLSRPFSHMVFQDTDARVSEHEFTFLRLSLLTGFGPKNELTQGVWRDESNVLEVRYTPATSIPNSLGRVQLVLQGKPEVKARILFTEDLNQGTHRTDRPNSAAQPADSVMPWTCFPRVSYSPVYSVFADAVEDLAAFRRAAREYLGVGGELDDGVGLERSTRGFRLDQLRESSRPSDLPSAATTIPSPSTPSLQHSSCPPRRAVFLTRHNRGIVNKDEIIQWASTALRVTIETATIDGESSSWEQASLFASSGLILTAHSSQTTNMVFSHSGSCVIEIAPEFWNNDFADYARSSGVKYMYAHGGEIEPESEFTFSQEHKDCLAELAPCEGDGFCIMSHAHRCPTPRHGPNKRKNFRANMETVKRAIKKCVDHLNWQCYGRWIL